MVHSKIAIGHVEEHSDYQIGTHLNLTLVIPEVLFFDHYVLIKDRLKVKCFKKIGISRLVSEFDPPENSQNLFIVFYRLHVVTLGIEFIGVLLVFVKVIEKSGEGFLSQFFQVVRVEEGVFDSEWESVQEFSL